MIRRTNTTVPLRWYAGGSPRLERIVVKAYHAFGVATYAEPEPSAGGEMGPYYQLAPSLQLIEGNLYWFRSRNRRDGSVNRIGASTRAYAKIITDINQLSLRDLLRPQANEARR